MSVGAIVGITAAVAYTVGIIVVGTVGLLWAEDHPDSVGDDDFPLFLGAVLFWPATLIAVAATKWYIRRFRRPAVTLTKDPTP